MDISVILSCESSVGAEYAKPDDPLTASWTFPVPVREVFTSYSLSGLTLKLLIIPPRCPAELIFIEPSSVISFLMSF